MTTQASFEACLQAKETELAAVHGKLANAEAECASLKLALDLAKTTGHLETRAERRALRRSGSGTTFRAETAQLQATANAAANAAAMEKEQREVQRLTTRRVQHAEIMVKIDELRRLP